MKTLKRFLMTVVAVCLLLCSCGLADQTPKDGDTVDTGCTDQPAKDENDRAYTEIERAGTSYYEKKYFGSKNDETLLQIPYPTEWRFEEEDAGGFSIYREDRRIGELMNSYAADTAQWTQVASQNNTVENVVVTMRIERNGTAPSAKYRYRVVYEYRSNSAERVVTLTVDCAEVNEMTELKLYWDAQIVKNGSSETFGMLSHISQPSEILILGNSFIGSSNIGYILSELLEVNGKPCTVNAISRGMAGVANYANDAEIVESLRSGRYDALFICGFYSASAVNALSVLVNACEASNTTLVIFPAHNEQANVVSSARLAYGSAYCLNWKAELDRLISTGVSRWDLCVDDTYDHSKPLAGYVGAHMIYRALYGVSPEKGMQSTLSQSEIDAVLGNYAKIGDAKFPDAEKILYFGQ